MTIKFQDLKNDLDTLLNNISWDKAIQYSLEKRHSENMQIVLRAYGMRHDREYATAMLVSLMGATI